MKTSPFCFLLFIFLSYSLFAEPEKDVKPQQTITKSSDTERVISWKDMQDALTKHREILEADANRNYLAFGGIVITALALGAYFFGKNAKEFKEAMRVKFEAEVLPELEKLKAEVTKARGEISQLSEYQTRRVIWIRRLGTVGVDEENEKIIKATKLDVKSEMLASDKPVSLANVDLVIFTYDGDDAIPLLKNIVDSLITKKLPLVVYAPGPRLADSETALLNAYGNYVPANSPLTLYERTLFLARLSGATK